MIGENMENLFTYGSLMCEDIMLEVSGLKLEPVHGILRYYRRLSVKGEHYPAIIPDSNSSVNGVAYLKVPPSSWKRLDRFEGEYYTRKAVLVELNNGGILTAGVYVFNQEFKDKLDETDWTFSEFMNKYKEKFVKDYKGYRVI
jgi:gamma-glutamylcyclotransferase (GGCT)/AIG2-like uncharacterized protein YtfP